MNICPKYAIVDTLAIKKLTLSSHASRKLAMKVVLVVHPVVELGRMIANLARGLGANATHVRDYESASAVLSSKSIKLVVFGSLPAAIAELLIAAAQEKEANVLMVSGGYTPAPEGVQAVLRLVPGSQEYLVTMYRLLRS